MDSPKTDSRSRSTIALAAVGNLGKYLCEELLHDSRFDVVVLSRKENEWCSSHSIPVYVTDYSEASVLSILDSTRAQALVSFLNFDNDRYVDIHRAFLGACQLSTQCKRLIPSEWAGNIDDFPHLPAFYCATREPFRQILRQRSSSDVEWTLFNNGWLMDYFLPPHKTYMEAVPDFFPIDPHRWHACIRGTGDELQSWTCGKEIAKAVAQLLASTEQWEQITYVSGEWSTFNEAIQTMEIFYGKTVYPLPVLHFV